jgi:hypothetical protein
MTDKLKTSQKSPDHWETVENAELAAWLSIDSPEMRELIVEARLPARQAVIEKRSEGIGNPRTIGVKPTTPDQRSKILAELYAFLADRLDVPPVLLKAAGAVAVKATSNQARQFVDHPLVKAIRPNRKLARAV